ncbi:UDP-N-acetyl-D-mannosamine dehydrogenase [Roseomonas sp. CCTCC AB2023176]|uniref:UDP-N-acetyl-D-mannosamine dehydrogenase n=1 Tax=Roseomonas sp. CCTCC AB2023176 TaxID=3342640 RepID=UPI0035DA1563
MKVCVVGLGYIGLPTAAMLASRGHEVVGCDTNPRVVESLNAGQSHFREPDLDMLLSAAVSTGRLTAGTAPVEADAFVLAVPTPFRDGRKPDLTYVEAATDSIAPHLRPGCTVILESTSPVGTTEALARRLAATRPDLRLPTYKSEGTEADVAVAHCPERILPGQMMRELVSNDRIIGGVTEACARRALTVYESFVAGETFLTDCRTAEFVKLAENAFRDVNIAFANELSVICAALDIDVWGAIALANKHPRVNILRPGAGVGGHCIAVDPWFIVDGAPEAARLIRTAREVNDGKPHWVTARIADLARRFRAPVIACYGLTYKPDVDDLRESPSLDIVASLAREDGATILACDPWVTALPPPLAGLPNLRLVDADTALREADIVAFLVAHRAFSRLDRTRLLNKMVVDAVGLTETRPA